MTPDQRPKPRKSSTINFSYHDPSRTFDGTPYEAAGASVEQTSNVVKLLRRAIADTAIQVRNAYMQRNLDTTGETGIENWDNSPENKMLRQFVTATAAMAKKLAALHRATTYDPQHPPKE